MADSEDVQFRVIAWGERRAPIRASRQYYLDSISTSADTTDSSFSLVICAYADSWRLAPGLARMLYAHRGAEDGVSVAAETNQQEQNFWPVAWPGPLQAPLRAIRLYYGNSFAQDDTGPTIEANNPSMVVGMRHRATRYLPYEFHRLIQYGDEGVVIVECANPRAKGGAPTSAGLARYVDGTTCSDPRHVHTAACGGGR